MKNVVQLTVVKLWQRFAELKQRSERTLDINDGIAAGKAYREFCESFLPKKVG